MASSFSLERRMLKDFLVDESPSCSSDDLKSWYPRKPCKLRARSLSTPNYKTPSQLLTGSRSKAASISISAVHRASDMVINAIKFFPFTTMKTPAILPRSISRKLSRRNKEDTNSVFLDAVSVKVKIKDILRWKSFRDVALESEEMPLSTSLEFSCNSPNHCSTTTRITTGSTSTDSTSSKRTSWCDSDFTVEDLFSCCSEDKDCMNEIGLKFSEHYLQECLEGTKTGSASKRELCFDEEDQHSPISVLEYSPFREDEELFHRNLATVERRKCRLMQRIQEFESLVSLKSIKNLERDHLPSEEDNSSFFEEDEDKNINDALHEKARKLLSDVKAKRRPAAGNNVKAVNSDHDHLLLDFFIHELMTIGSKLEQNEAKLNSEMLRLAESWLNKECNSSLDWEMLGKRENCIRDMEKELRWNSFEEEHQELGCELEIDFLNDFLDEILADHLDQ